MNDTNDWYTSFFLEMSKKYWLSFVIPLSSDIVRSFKFILKVGV
jgi:hypothetical protein